MRSFLPIAGAIVLAMTSAASAAQPVTLPSGLSYTDEVVGTGAEPKSGQQVTVHYTGWLDEGGGKVRLTEKETAILRYLYSAGQRPVSRETLLQEVWGYNSGVTTHTLETHIYRLRQKVEKDAATPAILVTEPGGYKLVP